MWTLLLSRIENPRTYIDRRQIDGGQIKIGRAVNRCDWVIPDHDGFVSREHCSIIVSGLDLFVLDTSTYGTVLNDAATPIPANQPIAIRVNDRLTLGDFIIEVAPEGAMAGAQLAPPPPAAMPGGGGAMGQDQWFQSANDPIWNPGVRDAEVHEFLGGGALNDLLGISPPSAPQQQGFQGFGGAGMGGAFTKPIMAPFDPAPGDFGIPEDWNLSAPAPTPAAFAPPPPPPAAFPPDFGTFDDLLAPRPPAPGFDPFPPLPGESGGDPFAPPPPSPSLRKGGDADRDPFAPPPGAYSPPAENDPFAHVFAPPAPTPPPAAAPPAAADDIFADFFAAPPGGAEPAPSPVPIAPPAPAPFAPPPPPAAAPFAAPAAAPGDDASWAAFCEGAGISADELRRSPDAMRRLGVFYRQVVLGLSDLIQDRAAFKNEFRMAATMLALGRNNPLKMLDPVDTARLLLDNPMPGYMPSDEAVRSAFEDIKKHQMAMLAGVQHALTAVFKRLAPAEIERLKEKAEGERRGLPFKRGVDAWTVYRTVFEALRIDATSNANSVMSVAFREGYEAFLKREAGRS